VLNLQKLNMKKLFVLAMSILTFGLNAQTIKTPAPSPTQTIKQDFGLSNIEIVYSRPAAKGRKVFGDLVPFGKLWRTGANMATKVTFGSDVKVGGVDVKAGSYALYTMPGATEWDIIINKGANNSGTGGYKAEDDVAKFKVKAQALASNVESFTIGFNEISDTKTTINVAWEKTSVAIPVEANIADAILSSIDKAMNQDNKPYFQAATYYFESGKDLPKALEWANKAVEMQPKAYWIAHLKAKIQAKSGDKAGAIATANKSIELAKEGKNDDYVALNEKLIASLK
jgi:Protein of unknown function (DUF2911)